MSYNMNITLYAPMRTSIIVRRRPSGHFDQKGAVHYEYMALAKKRTSVLSEAMLLFVEPRQTRSVFMISNRKISN